jgi:hypothetical protein
VRPRRRELRRSAQSIAEVRSLEPAQARPYKSAIGMAATRADEVFGTSKVVAGSVDAHRRQCVSTVVGADAAAGPGEFDADPGRELLDCHWPAGERITSPRVMTRTPDLPAT